jgi:hypothetical protein
MSIISEISLPNLDYVVSILPLITLRHTCIVLCESTVYCAVLSLLICRFSDPRQPFSSAVSLSLYTAATARRLRVAWNSRVDSSRNVMGTRWSTGGREGERETGEWSGQPVLFTLPRNMVYPALLPLMCSSRLPAVDWTDSRAHLNGLVRFAERRNLVSASVPSHFKRSLLHIAQHIVMFRLTLCWQRTADDLRDVSGHVTYCPAPSLVQYCVNVSRPNCWCSFVG